MANYEKYDPKVGGFRAQLAADWATGDIKQVIGVGLDASGHVVKGAGTTGVIGVLVLTKARKATEIVDVMTGGEIVPFTGDPGKKYFAAAADGVVSATSAAGKTLVDHTVVAGRLVVRVNNTAVA